MTAQRECEPIDDLGLCCWAGNKGEGMTFYTSEAEIEKLTVQARGACAEIWNTRRREPEHPEEVSWGTEYQLSREDSELFWKIAGAAIRADDVTRPAEQRKRDLQTALAEWTAAQGNKLYR